jgi:hypothetical protein
MAKAKAKAKGKAKAEAEAKATKEAPRPWSIRYYKRHKTDDPKESTPAREFLASCPVAVRADIVAVIKSVAEGPPLQFSGGGMWKAMHGAMGGFFEVRIMGPGKTLYRVFCLLERAAEGLGLDNDSLIVIDGMSKPHGTAFSNADYESIRSLGKEYKARKPRSTA